MTKQVHLVAVSGLSAATISRIIYEPGYNPDRVTIGALAAALQVSHEELLLFIHDVAAPDGPAGTGSADPLIADMLRMLGPDSPLDAHDQTNLRHMLMRDFALFRRRKSA